MMVIPVSLPLMGIGNELGGGGPHRPSGLTTPQGDREPGDEADFNRLSDHSLPLMGIGNLGQRGGRRQGDLGLTTPHGDRELRVGENTRAVSSSSLPLMGIGNRGSARAPR